MKKYEQDYLAMKQVEEKAKDPLQVLGEENKTLKLECVRLESDNDKLTAELISTKVPYASFTVLLHAQL